MMICRFSYRISALSVNVHANNDEWRRQTYIGIGDRFDLLLHPNPPKVAMLHPDISIRFHQIPKDGQHRVLRLIRQPPVGVLPVDVHYFDFSLRFQNAVVLNDLLQM
jgi:hypothetical protein